LDAFPFSETEWAAVNDAAFQVVNAGLTNDAVLRASSLIDLLDILGELRVQHGEHPVLLETEADFTDEVAERIELYRRAVRLATANNLPTLSIRLSLAEVFLDAGNRVAARDELRACEAELTEGDKDDRATWTKLVEQTR
jgi:hypothetical protein